MSSCLDWRANTLLPHHHQVTTLPVDMSETPTTLHTDGSPPQPLESNSCER